MTSLLKKAGLGLALGATMLAAAAPAEAQYRDRYYGRGHRGDAGPAIIAGVAGLAIGAAIASNNNRYRDRYYDRRLYRDRYHDCGYDDDRGFYDRGFYDRGFYPRRGFYDGYRGYYDDYRGYGRVPRCFVERRWDPYYGQPVRVRVCN